MSTPVYQYRQIINLLHVNKRSIKSQHLPQIDAVFRFYSYIIIIAKPMLEMSVVCIMYTVTKVTNHQGLFSGFRSHNRLYDSR